MGGRFREKTSMLFIFIKLKNVHYFKLFIVTEQFEVMNIKENV